MINSPNRLLACLPRDEYQRLSAHLRAVPLTLGRALYRARGPIDYVYFPTPGVVSAMAVMADGSAIEIATIGNEGMTGLTAFVGGGTSPNEVMVQGRSRRRTGRYGSYWCSTTRRMLRKSLTRWRATGCTRSSSAATGGC
jgi:hypothetical protein